MVGKEAISSSNVQDLIEDIEGIEGIEDIEDIEPELTPEQQMQKIKKFQKNLEKSIEEIAKPIIEDHGGILNDIFLAIECKTPDEIGSNVEKMYEGPVMYKSTNHLRSGTAHGSNTVKISYNQDIDKYNDPFAGAVSQQLNNTGYDDVKIVKLIIVLTTFSHCFNGFR